MYKPKPDWLKIKVRSSEEMNKVESLLRSLSLHTVCEEANCPNKMECFGNKTATFMILGRSCTRNCTFCNVSKNPPDPVDEQEPSHVARAVKTLGLRHVVVTCVTRDDLPDGGAEHFARVIAAIRKTCNATVEVLIPDFLGEHQSLLKVISAGPDIINHNLETVERLYPGVRPQAVYVRSLRLLERVKQADASIRTKSGIMVGLGESPEEVSILLDHLREVRCDFLTIGQYLAPS
ncbi:MAG: lipoyl synthase, partial [Clostridia bacterium]